MQASPTPHFLTDVNIIYVMLFWCKCVCMCVYVCVCVRARARAARGTESVGIV